MKLIYIDDSGNTSKKLDDIQQNDTYKPNFDYGSHSILKWLEENIGNQTKDKPIG